MRACWRQRLSGAVLLMTTVAAAGAAHITDRLVVGLLPAPDAATKPLTLLSSGTPVDVIERGAEFTRVRLADDTLGWVQTDYVTDEKPARAMLLETQAKLRRTGLELAALRERQGTPDDAESQRLRAALADAQARIAALEAGADGDRDPGAELAQLRRQSRAAAELLAAAHGLRLIEADSEEDGAVDGYLDWIVTLAALVLGFAAGIAFIDYRIRRRHGGYRL